MTAIERVIETALSQVGYMEKSKAAVDADPGVLDRFTDGAGADNYTKYARDQWKEKYFNSKKQGVAWCAVFVGWCFLKTFGKAAALRLQCAPSSGNCGAGCESQREYYRKKGQLYSDPMAGDQIFFGSDGEATHTGLVISVEGSTVRTVEGNTSPGNGTVIENGGQVCKKSYSTGNGRILGYGRPDYSMVPEKEEKTVGDYETVIIGGGSPDSGINLRAGKSTSTKKLCEIPQGSQAELIEYGDDWCKVRYGGKAGYVVATYVTYDGGIRESVHEVTENEMKLAAIMARMDAMHAEIGALCEEMAAIVGRG